MTENQKAKILIVDDERDNIRILFVSLRQKYDIIAADSGKLALEKAITEMPDLILLDIVMPDLDGYMILEQIKKNEITKNIPVIFITGLISPAEETKGLAMGAVDYIAKPFDMNVVRSRIKKQLQVAGKINSGIIACQVAENQMQSAYTLINSSPQYISYINSAGEYEFLNPATSEITGYTKEELLKGGFELLFDNKTNRHLREEIFPRLKAYGKYDFELPIIRKDGKVLIMAFSAFETLSDNNKFGFIANDITEQKRLREEIIEAKETAEKANNAKGEFLSRMSHELRTPLNAIKGMLSIAMKTPKIDKITDCLQKVEKATEHLTDLVNEILDMATINLDKVKLINNRFNIKEMINYIIVKISHRSDQKMQTFKVQIDESIPEMIISDERRLSQILTNLLSNANKFTPENGSIALELHKISQNEKTCILKFVVKDNGIGISPEQQKRIFESFEQADGGVTRTYSGSGLGLAISKKIVEQMGGELCVESSLGNGATFYFTIEAEFDNKDEEILKKSKQSKQILRNKVILAAEDVAINREILEAVFEETGAAMVFAEDGKVAYELFANDPQKYDLILMDINMPVMDGYQSTTKIRALNNEKAKTIPIIALTANTYKEDVDRCLAVGMNDHIGKPIDFDELLDKAYGYIKPVK